MMKFAAPPDDTEELRRFTVMLARRITRGQFDAEDLAHEVLERWLRSAPRLAAVNPRAWLTVVLRRLVVDRLRRRRAAAEVAADWTALPDSEPDAAPWWCDIEAGVLRRELGRLPPTLRETFELFSFQDQSYQQIACRQNIALGTVGTRISRARALLKQRLVEDPAAPAVARDAAHSRARSRHHGRAESALRSTAFRVGAGGRMAGGGSRSEAAGELASR
ncbi:MAG TPA: RNA polymerase sigma factor [Kofleriaceae bacterium]|nr:RNA polymerase sigma factor [Kofleriaceae bacterium]